MATGKEQKHNLSILTGTELQTYIIFEGQHIIRRIQYRNQLAAEQHRNHVCPSAELALVLPEGGDVQAMR